MICVDWCPLESHPENSAHPVRYYCRCQCNIVTYSDYTLGVGSLICGKGCRQILEMRRLFNCFNLFQQNTSSRSLSQINNNYLNIFL